MYVYFKDTSQLGIIQGNYNSNTQKMEVKIIFALIASLRSI